MKDHVKPETFTPVSKENHCILTERVGSRIERTICQWFQHPEVLNIRGAFMSGESRRLCASRDTKYEVQLLSAGAYLHFLYVLFSRYFSFRLIDRSTSSDWIKSKWRKKNRSWSPEASTQPKQEEDSTVGDIDMTLKPIRSQTKRQVRGS